MVLTMTDQKPKVASLGITPLIKSPRWFWLALVTLVVAPDLVDRIGISRGWWPSPAQIVAPAPSEQASRIETKLDGIDDQLEWVIQTLQRNYEDEWNGSMERTAQRQLLAALKASTSIVIPYDQLPDVREIQRANKRDIQWSGDRGRKN